MTDMKSAAEVISDMLDRGTFDGKLESIDEIWASARELSARQKAESDSLYSKLRSDATIPEVESERASVRQTAEGRWRADGDARWRK